MPQHHIICQDEDIARYVLCPGDLERAHKIAGYMQDMRLVSETRGYRVYSGYYEGTFMTSIGTGIGGPQAAIAYEELANMGADTFIRVGSCGVFQPGHTTGQIVIATGAVRDGGTSTAYLPIRYPAAATFAVLRVLVEAAEALAVPHAVGVTRGRDALYAPPDSERMARLIKAGVLASEMEADTLFVVGAYRRWRTGAILVAGGPVGQPRPENAAELFASGEEQAIRVALTAMAQLARRDTD